MEAILPQVSDLFPGTGASPAGCRWRPPWQTPRARWASSPRRRRGISLEAAHVEKLALDRYDEFYAKTGHPMVSMLRLLEAAAGLGRAASTSIWAPPPRISWTPP
ncbi:MAG: hypothetical protein ACLU9S_05255 [Oscillospiraceae bacterium]